MESFDGLIRKTHWGDWSDGPIPCYMKLSNDLRWWHLAVALKLRVRENCSPAANSADWMVTPSLIRRTVVYFFCCPLAINFAKPLSQLIGLSYKWPVGWIQSVLGLTTEFI
jgi:hypothetical protein